MNIFVADNSGFCFGVEKAINLAAKTTDKYSTVYSLGPLIHNKQVIDRLKDKGLNVVDNIDKLKNSRLIIRSHGVPLEIYEKADKQGIEIIDTTCPFVRNIQEKVKTFYKKGYQIVIIGNPEHPEVVGINGWCENTAYIVNLEDDIEDIEKCDKICIVAQTTMTKEKFESLTKMLAEKADEISVFNTICNATRLRQQACADIAKKVDAMIVIGGYHSSNTQKLASISKAICTNTYHIETSDDLPLEEILKYETIGITAGASTPDWIIKEVVNKLNNADNGMNEMMEEIEKSLIELKKGEVVKGKVISVNENEVMVNIGYKSDGIIERNELSNDPSINPTEIINVGDEIEVYIIKLDDGEGNVILSKKRVDTIKGLENIEELYNNAEIVEAKVVEIVKGGAIAVVNNLRGFIPASHISYNYVKNLDKFLGETLNVKIIEFDRNKKRIILSRKEVEKKEIEKKKEQLWESLEKGKKVEGEVKRLTNFGAFVDIGGVDGLVHISELSWGRVNHPSEVLSEGDTVEVEILDFNKKEGKISLGLKQTKPHPWNNVNEKYNEGDIVEGKVVRLVDFGAFVELEPGLDGLVHISQISEEHIAKPSEVLTKGQKVNVKILEVKEEEQRISLSIKAAEGKETEATEYKDDEEEVTIEDQINTKE
ncbi:MAG: bifunctional 4-hydroxy-3-methylbut-2-enyl diphosphate reductase/30S ribosomal protein S1 [Firmicutes bacterium]|nr:bifunctional 4-hydroxy-3-methylbut-2-enyl diphosphate reductase/30S ribosomal protein S1 [Bacillota bacterium]